MANPRKPVMLDAEALSPAPSPQDAPPVPELDAPQNAAMQRATFAAGKPKSWLSKLFWGAIFALLGMAISLAAWDFVAGLLTRNIWLGRAALGLVAVVVLVLIVVILRELIGFSRLRTLDSLRAESTASRSANRAGALKTIAKLDHLYTGRPELRWARGELQAQQPDILDADALMDVAEQQLMAPLDALARLEIEAASRQVAAATALIPLALIDVLVALTSNVSMIRKIAVVYGGRAGVLGSWRLLKGVAAHLIATGAVAIGDDMIGSMAGGGALSKVSRKFGEGVINGTLTARVGVAAMEICRPMPFEALKRPRASSIVKSALVGMFK
ncbi:MAG: TIGR01620 family protein [Rhodobacteraceae bacterium]|nr:TIGR01620 family protein [Paracoccaceae bacterium]